MKLLIITQVIDIEHPILGFFHRWVLEFAKHCEHVHVIALQVGTHSLPANVTVHSLGKDEGKGRLTYVRRFYTLIWSLRHEYDNVFVHMNQLYVILGAPLWQTLRKKVGLWYAHGAVSNSLKLAVMLADTIFTSTAEGMRIQTPKKAIVGQGIDTDLFCQANKEPSDGLRLITVGRISQSKNLETLIRACASLKKEQIDFTFSIVGEALTAKDVAYKEKMKALCAELAVEKSILWTGSMTQAQLPAALQQADVFIHDGSTNSLDKTLLEASLCGCTVISSNPAYVRLVILFGRDLVFTPHDHTALKESILLAREDKADTSEQIRLYIKEHFNVANLVSGILGKM